VTNVGYKLKTMMFMECVKINHLEMYKKV